MSKYTIGLSLRNWNHLENGSRRALRSSALNAWLVTNLCIINTKYDAMINIWLVKGGLLKKFDGLERLLEVAQTTILS